MGSATETHMCEIATRRRQTQMAIVDGTADGTYIRNIARCVVAKLFAVDVRNVVNLDPVDVLEIWRLDSVDELRRIHILRRWQVSDTIPEQTAFVVVVLWIIRHVQVIHERLAYPHVKVPHRVPARVCHRVAACVCLICVLIAHHPLALVWVAAEAVILFQVVELPQTSATQSFGIHALNVGVVC